MPEEVNRIVADRFSELPLPPQPTRRSTNLRAEGIPDERMHFVGNTMIDTLVALEDRFRAAGAAAGSASSPAPTLLVTLHRPALVDGPLLARRSAQLAALAREMPVVFPVHPRTRKMMEGVERRAPGPAADRAARLPRLPLAARRRRRRPHRLRRHPGGDDLPRRPLLHPARQHRAPGHDHAPAPTPCSASTRRRSPASRPRWPSAADSAQRAAAALGRPRRGADRRRDR